MRTFELRQYTLRGKEALEIYMNQVYPRHLDSFPLFGIEPHGVWTVKDSAEPHGQSLTPVLAALKDWGDTHLDLFNNKTGEKIIDTRTAAKGALAMSRKKVIVKRLNAIQNFGGMDVLCTDKTGTLTEDRVVLQRHCNVAGRETDEVLRDGYLISHFQTGLKNLLDTAILNSSDFHEKALIEKYKKLDEIPFDFTRRMMSVLVENPEGKAILLTKGAPEEIFHQCSQFELDGKLSPMDPTLMKGLKDQYASLSNDGFRVLAVAVKELAGKTSCAKEDEHDLVLKGYVAFLDPPTGWSEDVRTGELHGTVPHAVDGECSAREGKRAAELNLFCHQTLRLRVARYDVVLCV